MEHDKESKSTLYIKQVVWKPLHIVSHQIHQPNIETPENILKLKQFERSINHIDCKCSVKLKLVYDSITMRKRKKND